MKSFTYHICEANLIFVLIGPKRTPPLAYKDTGRPTQENTHVITTNTLRLTWRIFNKIQRKQFETLYTVWYL